MKAIATWRLERGATIGLLEYLLGSRSMASAFMAPVKFRTFNLFVPLLIMMWAFSPAGGQSSLRIITVEPKYTNVSQDYQYLDLSSSPFTLGLGGSAQASYATLVYAAFNAALTSPQTSKNGSQDMFGNVQLPMLESLVSSTTPDANGWYSTEDKKNMTYTSLLGLPILGAQGGANSTFNVETSYFNLDCAVVGTELGPSSNLTLETPVPGMELMTGQGYNVWFDAYHSIESQQPRKVGFRQFAQLQDDSDGRYMTTANCSLSTTYVEASVFCNETRSCDVRAIRSSKLSHSPGALSVLDGLVPGTSGPLAATFFETFTNATTGTHIASSGPIEYYFIDPAHPFSAMDNWVPIAPIGSELFSRRFGQLLNTYYLSGVAPNGMIGDFTYPTNDEYGVATSSGISQTMQLVMRCHTPYLIVLVIASSIIFLAGMTTAYLDAFRRGPDVLDNFVNTLRDSPHVHCDFGPSMEDGTDKIKRLRRTTVKMGDVRPGDPVGMVAIATPTANQPVHKLTPKREYM